MLYQRVLTAVVLITLLVLAVLKLNTLWFAGLLGLFVLLAAWEWAVLSGWTTFFGKLFYSLLVLASLFLLYRWQAIEGLSLAILASGVMWWGLALIWLKMSKPDAGMSRNARFYKALAGLFVLIPAWYALVMLHEQTAHQGPMWVLYVFVLVWLADIGAYFSGKRFGRTKLAPALSPGKTWEGVLGGLLVVGLYAAVVAYFYELALQAAGMLVLLSLLVSLLSVAGDLFESLFKRQARVKDSGNLFPGHGGVMDRIDSLTAAAPFYVSGLLWLGLNT
ncbi:MAG TPA: phosphatidate cytidylyltransferase [Gammaproteobacteria bacterium]|nr:phosphatidate cytidylyltransferase [Gammaproteobacteria bacterium]